MTGSYTFGGQRPRTWRIRMIVRRSLNGMYWQRFRYRHSAGYRRRFDLANPPELTKTW